jgi:hypothetical protein
MEPWKEVKGKGDLGILTLLYLAGEVYFDIFVPKYSIVKKRAESQSIESSLWFDTICR